MSALQSSDGMSFCVFLLYSGLTFTSGCTGEWWSFSCSPGESVLLPCRDVDSRVTDVQWWFSIFWTLAPQYSVFDSSEAHRYKDRVQIHRNHSLSISRLTLEDAGLYWCKINPEPVTKYVMQSVEGCTAAEAEAEPEVKYPGESVLLSCSCEEPKTKPEEFRWSRVDSSGTEVSIETSRVHMFNKESPSNLSLLISSLTEEDQGTYRCFINNRPATSTRLTVKGCVLSEYPKAQTSHVGKSVTLPCSCEDPKTKPKHSEWRRADGNETLVSDTEDRNGRFQMIRDPPQSLSLRISNLSEADGGQYVCTVNGGQSRTITFTVTRTEVGHTPIVSPFFLMLLLLLVLTISGCIYWMFTRARKEKSGSRMMLKPDHEYDETYTTVIYSLTDQEP